MLLQVHIQILQDLHIFCIEIWKQKTKTELILLLIYLSVFCDDKYKYIFFTKSKLTTFWWGWKLSMNDLHSVSLDNECFHDACSITRFPYQWNENILFHYEIVFDVQNSWDIIMLLGLKIGTLRSPWKVCVSYWSHCSKWNKKPSCIDINRDMISPEDSDWKKKGKKAEKIKKKSWWSNCRVSERQPLFSQF